jgi:queuine tRNA-ribosyltransferase
MGVFRVICKDSRHGARRGVLTTVHGTVETPVFMPVGTLGAVKGVTPDQVAASGAEMILANTYHLLLRPGVECIERLGGLHEVMGWDKPILTDSGGYQVFSLGGHLPDRVENAQRLTKVDDEGVEFTSHFDGAKMYINAEIATNIQNRLGADVIMCFDQCTPYPCDEGVLKKAVERTIRWARQCKEANRGDNQLLFGIVQGGVDLSLRGYCAQALVGMEFDGYAIGGLSVGEGHDHMVATVVHTAGILPESKPRYLMGVGMPSDIVAAVQAGIDMFDCVLPTRNGRNAFAFTESGPVRLRNSIHSDSTEPVETGCDCYCCRNFSRGVIRHYFNVGEMLGPILLSIHNLQYYQRLMAKIRSAIEMGEFEEWSAGALSRYAVYNEKKAEFAAE